jgi:uncharacterized protein with gpF-like domain
MPKPKQGESEHNFIDRCMKDPEAISDFPNAGQRMAFCYSQYESKSDKMITKAASDGWGIAFEDEMRKSEKATVPSVRRFYEAEYQKGIDAFITSGLINPNTVFQTNGFREIYKDLYQTVGMRFAKWYAKNFDKYIKKGVNPKQFESIWQNLFAQYALANAGSKISLVQGTAKQTLVKILRANMADPEFSALGADAKQRVLRKQTKRYSKNQALRLVRTESTNAANYATMQSATSIFPAQQMMKEWVAGLDDRTRDDHAAASGQQVKFEEPFIVGGDRMMHPADSSMGASSANIVNCRCSSFPFPMENAQSTQVFESIGLGIAAAAIVVSEDDETS